MKDAPELLRLSDEDCPKIWIGLPRARTPQHWNSIDVPVVHLGAQSSLSPIGWTLTWEREVEKVPIEEGREKVPGWQCVYLHHNLLLFLSVYVDDMKMAGKTQNMPKMWRTLQNKVDLEDRVSSWMYSTSSTSQGQNCDGKAELVLAADQHKYTCTNPKDIAAWSYDMEEHAQKCLERNCELARRSIDQLHNVSALCLDDHQIKPEDLENVGELSETCSQIVLKCLYLARIGRPDLLWHSYYLARSVTKFIT